MTIIPFLIFILLIFTGLLFTLIGLFTKPKFNKMIKIGIVVLSVPLVLILFSIGYEFIHDLFSKKPTEQELVGTYHISEDYGLLKGYNWNEFKLVLKEDKTFELTPLPMFSICEVGEYELDYEYKLNELTFREMPEEVQKYLKTISNAAHRITNLVRSILDLSRLGKNKEMVIIDCDLVIQNIITDLNQLIKSTGTKINVEHLGKIEGYETEVRQLFQNLISNAIKFRKKDSSPIIKIGHLEKPSSHEFYVQDNGIGIEQKHFSNFSKAF